MEVPPSIIVSHSVQQRPSCRWSHQIYRKAHLVVALQQLINMNSNTFVSTFDLFFKVFCADYPLFVVLCLKHLSSIDGPLFVIFQPTNKESPSPDVSKSCILPQLSMMLSSPKSTLTRLRSIFCFYLFDFVFSFSAVRDAFLLTTSTLTRLRSIFCFLALVISRERPQHWHWHHWGGFSVFFSSNSSFTSFSSFSLLLSSCHLLSKTPTLTSTPLRSILCFS